MILNYVFKDDDFEYEINSKELTEALKYILTNEFEIKKDNVSSNNLLNFILNTLEVEDYLCERYEDEINKYFEDDAFESFQTPTLEEIENIEYNEILRGSLI